MGQFNVISQDRLKNVTKKILKKKIKPKNGTVLRHIPGQFQHQYFSIPALYILCIEIYNHSDCSVSGTKFLLCFASVCGN